MKSSMYYSCAFALIAVCITSFSKGPEDQANDESHHNQLQQEESAQTVTNSRTESRNYRQRSVEEQIGPNVNVTPITRMILEMDPENARRLTSRVMRLPMDLPNREELYAQILREELSPDQIDLFRQAGYITW